MSKESKRRRNAEREREKATREAIDRINEHRLPLAIHIRKRNELRAKEKDEKDVEKRRRRVMASISHPNRGKHVAVMVVVIAFCVIAIGSLAIGGHYAKDDKSTNLQQATVSDISPTSREQRDVLAMSGEFDTFTVNGIRQSVFDGTILSDEYVTWSETRAKRDEEKRQETAKASSQEDDGNENVEEQDNGEGNTIGTSFNDGNASSTGIITSEQEDEGRKAVEDALNQYSANADETNENAEQ